MEIARVYSDVTRDDLGKFNELLPSPYKLFPEQLESAVMAYQFEMNAILGPSGSGKTTIFCFLAIYNWFALRRKTLLLTTRRGAANEITLRIVRMSKFLLELPQFRHLNNERQYIWCKLEKDSLLEHKDPEIRDVCSFDHEHPEQITMLVAVLNFLTSAPVLRFKCDRIVMDEASSVSTLNFYTLLAVQNMEKRHLPQHLTIFGDQFQLSARFSKETFLGDKDEKDFGFDESALVQLLKCKLPCTQMKSTVRSPKALCKIIQPFYDYTISADLTALARPLALRFDPFGGLCDLHRIVHPKFVSIFINLPAKDANGNHFCAADGRRDSEPDRRLNLINRRNIHYALCIFDAILERNSDISNKDCLYLTPYRVQESEFHHRRSKPGATGSIRGQTIDRAVSTEAPFVLLDLVRTSSNGFMNGTPEEWPAYGTAQRLLVALSRATRAQIIIGSVGNSLGTPSNPIEKLAAYHRDSRDSLVGYIDMPSSRFSSDHYKV
ncbi:unnamed protein product [Bursaphelenchus xylophilus]|uniref:(pine wood nematode) hypothetical protein n=1 Tax=Bursaphelenchus xylophilus TaxID=6326 RepID=A0A7I8XHI4_BURXY|nr:unnamed protein product [Bursaphelenchus xylophilus]CAG9081517.1 unnamed protein product [Bursaphelenchus xylophilus]